VFLRPIPGLLQSPAIDDVADQINGFGIVIPEEIEKKCGLATWRAKVHIGNEERSVSVHEALYAIGS
jgi:hypothetical protein